MNLVRDSLRIKEGKKMFSPSSLVTALAFEFVYSGILRGFFFQEYANVLFFLRLPIIAMLFFLALREKNHGKDFRSMSLLILVFYILAFQLVHLVSGDINETTFVYGFHLYGLPLLGLYSINKLKNSINIAGAISIFRSSILLNLGISILQVFFERNEIFSAGFGETLFSADGTPRASGTFTSHAGFSLYLTIVLALLATCKSETKPFKSFHWISWFMMLAISGSRSAVLSTVPLLLVIAIIHIRGSLKRDRLLKTRISTFLFLVIAVYLLFLMRGVVESFWVRWVKANDADPPTLRLLNEFRIPISDVSFGGVGLGVRSRGSLSESISNSWIENEWFRISVEGGFSILVVFIIIRLYLIAQIFKSGKRRTITKQSSWNKYRFIIFAVVPQLAFGQLVGQGSISGGVWLAIYMAVVINTRPIIRDFQR